MVMGSMGATLIQNALSAANKVIAANNARFAANATKVASSITAAGNPNPPAPAGGIPTPVLVGGVAAVGLLAVILIAKKKKKK
jgi:hypothetical protein